MRDRRKDGIRISVFRWKVISILIKKHRWETPGEHFEYHFYYKGRKFNKWASVKGNLYMRSWLWGVSKSIVLKSIWSCITVRYWCKGTVRNCLWKRNWISRLWILGHMSDCLRACFPGGRAAIWKRKRSMCGWEDILRGWRRNMWRGWRRSWRGEEKKSVDDGIIIIVEWIGEWKNMHRQTDYY